MINNRITRDKRIHDMSDDTSRLAFTWLITFADCDGRTHGDPAIVRSILFPRRSDISIEQTASYIAEWSALGLVLWYEAEGDQWIVFSGFEKYQIGIRKDREPTSDIPEYNPDTCRILAGYLPEQIPVKLKEVKRKEVDNSNDLLSQLQTAFINASGIPSFGQNDLESLQVISNAGCTPDDVIEAIHVLQKKKYTIKGVKSIEVAAINIVKQRLTKKADNQLEGYSYG